MLRPGPRLFASDGIATLLANRVPAGVRLKNILAAPVTPDMVGKMTSDNHEEHVGKYRLIEKCKDRKQPGLLKDDEKNRLPSRR
jgi:hypothetical protein